MIYLASFAVTFCAVFLKGFQQKNVVGGHMKTIAFVSFCMAAFDVASIALIVKGGWAMIFSTGSGGALGMVSAIKMHDRVFGKKS